MRAEAGARFQYKMSLEPVLATMLPEFLFVIHGFLSDNGGEFINQTVAKLLNKLMIQQTKSQSEPFQR
jgi:hypothetical protein